MGELVSFRSQVPLDVEGREGGAAQGGLEDHGEHPVQGGECKLELADGCQVWVCIMFAALNIDRNNISNAVSDNMLEDLDLTKADYVSQSLRGVSHQSEDLTVHYQTIGQTISRVGFLVAELPSQLISKR